MEFLKEVNIFTFVGIGTTVVVGVAVLLSVVIKLFVFIEKAKEHFHQVKIDSAHYCEIKTFKYEGRAHVVTEKYIKHLWELPSVFWILPWFERNSLTETEVSKNLLILDSAGNVAKKLKNGKEYRFVYYLLGIDVNSREYLYEHYPYAQHLLRSRQAIIQKYGDAYDDKATFGLIKA